MKLWSLLIVTFSFCSVAHTSATDKELDVLLSTSPEAAAEKTFASGNAQYFVVPACGELIPGYPATGLKSEPPAFTNARRPAGTCEQFLGKDKMDQMRRLRDFAEAHNRRLNELQSKKAQAEK